MAKHTWHMMMDEHSSPNRELLNSLPHGLNNPDRLVPRINRRTWSHVPFHHIRSADATSIQLDEQFARPNLWHREINDPYIIVGMIFNNTH